MTIAFVARRTIAIFQNVTKQQLPCWAAWSWFTITIIFGEHKICSPLHKMMEQSKEMMFDNSFFR